MSTTISDSSDVINDGNGGMDHDYDSNKKIGGILKATRKLRNEKLKQVSGTLRIRQVYLEALENDEFEKLPGACCLSDFLSMP